MKYFCIKEELSGTDCHEFFKGEWDGRNWNEDSIFIYDDVFRDIGLRKIFRSVVPDYSPYDSTEIFPDEWEKIKLAAEDSAAEAVREAEEWVKDAFAESGMFTILGI